MERISPLVDFAFKKLFGIEENKDILIELINSIVSEKDVVSDITIENPYNEKNFKNDKKSILDIKAKCKQSGKWYNIEMQFMNQDYYDVRALYYWSRMYNYQLSNGINYDNLKKTIAINFLNFNCLDEEKYHNVYGLLNLETKNEYPADHLEIHFVELKKYHNELSSLLDKWVQFLNNATKYSVQNLPQELRIPAILKATDALEHINFTAEERETYEARLKWLRDEEMALKKAKREGLEEGMQKATINIVKQMLNSGLEISMIQKITGLSQLKIQQIQENN